ncbi:ROK family protein [Bifidobacterium saguinibicoloris]|uniref:ROK family protein n=1 Tax=Bifidobacterium saguinibicoloris TaxID=2834433 RepID=UPI001C571892|nr:ROK family protein [Bifidobacterium saguinibicoloris]MBW3081679.1 ROK family protein [Bifidobacterium saguinibicoloris]
MYVKSNPSDARANNRRLLFRLLFPDGQLSRADLCKRTGLSRATATDVTGEMIEDGLLRELGAARRDGRGKPGTLLAIDTDALRLVCVDLSRPYVMTGAVMDLRARIVERRERVLDDGDRIDPGDVLSLVDEMVRLAGPRLVGIGVAVPGVVSGSGRVVSSSNLGWSGVELRDLLEGEFSLPVRVDNDASAALLADRFLGRGEPNCLLVQVTRGIGASVLLNDEFVEGDDHAAGEIGHVVVDPSGPACACGKHGCLETYVSAVALRERIRREPGRRADILAEAGTRLGGALVMPVSLLNLHDIAVYGPPDLVGDAFLDACAETINSLSRSDFQSVVRVRRCELGDDATLRGQAVCVLRAIVGRRGPSAPAAS